MKKQYFNCECGEKVKLTKHKLDTEKGILLKMSDEEIDNFRHNKKCPDCIEKEEDVNKEVKIWRASILCQDEADEEGEDVVDGVNTSYFKNKKDALDFLCIKLRALLNNSDMYDDNGDLEASKISLGCQQFKLN